MRQTLYCVIKMERSIYICIRYIRFKIILLKLDNNTWNSRSKTLDRETNEFYFIYLFINYRDINVCSQPPWAYMSLHTYHNTT